MEPNIEKIVQQLQERFGASFVEFRGEAQVLVQPGQIIAALAFLRDEPRFMACRSSRSRRASLSNAKK